MQAQEQAGGDRAALDLQPLWQARQPGGELGSALAHPWGPVHRPDWVARGLIVWPRGGQWRHLTLRLVCPEAWRCLGPQQATARLALRWWADQVELRSDGAAVHAGDLFDTACRWPLPPGWWQGEALSLELRLRSPLHDDGALITSRLELEPRDPADPHGLLAAPRAQLLQLRQDFGRPEIPGEGLIHVLGHAHLDLAWLWPVADTWQAAERTFRSALSLLERFPALHFGHSTPALYAWLEQHRPSLFARIRAAMREGRWEPLNGSWVETDCVLISTASLLRQFQEGQHYSRRTFPEWSHQVSWLPDTFGFGAGLPAVAAATGVRWFCTHKLAWNATNRFPHRLFRWRSRCGAELLSLMTAPIGTDGDPVAIERYRLEWQRATGVEDALWLPGVGDHGGGPTVEMLEQLALWQQQPVAAGQRYGTLRQYLERLEPLVPGLPVWRDELYLELHRGCATSRPDQKRHNRSLERLLREADLALALRGAEPAAEAPDWRPLLFQQFHDILPGTSIPEVFEQAEPQWRQARRRARCQRDQALAQGLGGSIGVDGPVQVWKVVQLQAMASPPRTVRLPAGCWSLLEGEGGDQPLTAVPLQGQPAPGGGQWLQLPGLEGVGALSLRRDPVASPAADGSGHGRPLEHPVRVEPVEGPDPDRWCLANGLIAARIGPEGVEQLFDAAGTSLLAAPLSWCRWADRGEFWDAWDIAADYRDHPLSWRWQGAPQWLERGPLCARFVWRGQLGGSRIRLDGCLLAGSPWLELVLGVQWHQRHELLRLEIPLAQPAVRWAADTSGGVIERPAEARTAREQARWEVAAIRWLASQSGERAEAPSLAVLLDGPQGVSANAQQLGVSLLRGPTWPDPGADNGWQRQRLALMPCAGGWRQAGVPEAARSLGQPLWCRPWRPAVAASAWPGFPAQHGDLELLALRQAEGCRRDVLVTLQNLGPCRRRLELNHCWQFVERLDGLDQPLPQPPDGTDPLVLGPWGIGFWRLRRSD